MSVNIIVYWSIMIMYYSITIGRTIDNFVLTFSSWILALVCISLKLHHILEFVQNMLHNSSYTYWPYCEHLETFSALIFTSTHLTTELAPQHVFQSPRDQLRDDDKTVLSTSPKWTLGSCNSVDDHVVIVCVKFKIGDFCVSFSLIP